MIATFLLLLMMACGGAAAPDDQPLRVGGDVKAPVLVEKVEPDYPAGVRVTPKMIVLEGVITKRGDVRDLRIIAGADAPFADRVVAAVRQWKFRPGTKNGKPVDVIYNVTSYVHVR